MYDLHRAQEPQLGSIQTHVRTPSLLPPLSLSPAPLPPFPQKFLRFLDSHEACPPGSKGAAKSQQQQPELIINKLAAALPSTRDYNTELALTYRVKWLVETLITLKNICIHWEPCIITR